jgi:predicted dehydrogenase
MAGVHAAAAGDAGLRIVAVASATGGSARHLAGELDARRVSAADLPAGAEVLVVATPPTAHVDATLAGLAADATVLVESPIAATLSDADRMVTAAGRSTGRLRATANLRCSPAWRAALERIAQLGPLGHLSASLTQPTPDWGHFRHPLQAGGVLFASGAQLLPLLLDAAGAASGDTGRIDTGRIDTGRINTGRITTVAAELSTTRDDGADDRADVTFQFGADHTATLHAEWGPGASTWLQAAGAGGAVRVEFAPSISVEHNGEPVVVDGASTSPLHQLGDVDQLAGLSTTNDGTLDADEATHLLEVVTAAYVSAGRGGEPVTVPLETARDRTPLELWRSS